MKKEVINKIFEIWYKNDNSPKTELNYTNNYTLLIAVVLSAQATDIGVNKATKELFRVADSAQKMLDLGEDKLKSYINSIGLYNSKAKNIIKLSAILIKDFNNEIPQDLDQLQKLPGVGRKTANVVLNCAFNKPTIAVDTHVFRVANRIGFVKEKDVIKTEIALLKKIPKNWLMNAHHWMILHGRYICIARNPKCKICKIAKYCKTNNKRNES